MVVDYFLLSTVNFAPGLVERRLPTSIAMRPRLRWGTRRFGAEKVSRVWVESAGSGSFESLCSLRMTGLYGGWAWKLRRINSGSVDVDDFVGNARLV